MSNIYYQEKLTFSNFVGKVNLLERKYEEMHWLWRQKRCKIYLGKHLFYHYCLQLSFVSAKPCLRFLLICFPWEIKGFYQSYLGIDIDFRTFPQISWPKIENSKNWDSWMKEHLHLFACKRMKRCENRFLTLIMNYCKIIGTEKNNVIQNNNKLAI